MSGQEAPAQLTGSRVHGVDMPIPGAKVDHAVGHRPGRIYAITDVKAPPSGKNLRHHGCESAK